jgi:hypothetical protein
MRLSEWAEREGVHYQTAWKWFRDGKLPVPARQTQTGVILVDVPRREGMAGVVLYARVSSSDQREDLERQVGRLAAWATGQGLGVTVTVAEVGSGLNGSRSKLKRLLADPAVGTVVVERGGLIGRAVAAGTGMRGTCIAAQIATPARGLRGSACIRCSSAQIVRDAGGLRGFTGRAPLQDRVRREPARGGA